MTHTDAVKPRVSARSIPWLCAIDDYIRRYDVRGPYLHQAASDVLDGWAASKEIDDLIRRRLLCIVPTYEGDRDAPDLCGTSWTVDLTDRAMRAFWPERMEAQR